MTQRSEIEADRIPEVLSFFGVGSFRTATRINYGLANHNYAVSTDQGEYVVRFLATQTPQNAQNEIAIQQQLRQAGVGAPQFLRNKVGGYLFRGNNITAVIAEKLDGVTPDHMSVELAREIGRYLALFHTSVRTLPNRNDAGLMNPQVSSVDSEGARGLFEQSLPRGIIHGDLHSGNVLVDPYHRDRLLAILDFEEAGANLLLIDLAVTLMTISSPAGGESLEPEFLRAVKRGYEAVRKLTDEEVVWLPQAIRYASEVLISWFLANGFEKYARQHQRIYDGFEEVFGDHLAL